MKILSIQKLSSIADKQTLLFPCDLFEDDNRFFLRKMSLQISPGSIVSIY